MSHKIVIIKTGTTAKLVELQEFLFNNAFKWEGENPFDYKKVNTIEVDTEERLLSPLKNKESYYVDNYIPICNFVYKSDSIFELLGLKLEEMDNVLRYSVGTMIRDRRKAMKLSQTELARKSGVAQNYISAIERSGLNTRLSNLEAIADTLGGIIIFAPLRP